VITVSIECGGSADLLGKEVRPHNATTLELHWLRIPERIQFRLCVLAYRCLTGTAPQYLADTLSLSTNVADRCRLRSADSQMLQLPSTRRTTLGDQAFSVTAARQFAA